MARVKIPDNILAAVKKYRYPLIVVAIGVLLMLIPGKSEEVQPEVQSAPVSAEEGLTVQEQLEQILSKVQGAGKVSVMLSISSGEKTIYQTDQDITGGDTSERYQTVVITGKDREESGLIKQVDPEVYLGAIVVCQGADSPAVRLSIVEAVSKITGLGADRISVLKMK